ncbi:hypothetical protein PVA45_06010 [Entomospira entomophila]|uniref:Uncharacterized protein n=1 Tax=Entomospira entomophila TaxID=2719988 RepID=A0A968KRS3_9SPIO|nr:hypothetical protein [Entomospira entomophilus]NIZ41053.1 hypothetical protein [Entomospira entomophilus]WDI35262.1 hypothetical protein PVA45_06010 [Entomospira entomophilus]
MSSDPAMGEYLSTSEDAPAGGVFNSRNLQTYHYAGNNPIRYTDPTGRYDTDYFTSQAYQDEMAEHKTRTEAAREESKRKRDEWIARDPEGYAEYVRVQEHANQRRIYEARNGAFNFFDRVTGFGGGIGLIIKWITKKAFPWASFAGWLGTLGIGRLRVLNDQALANLENDPDNPANIMALKLIRIATLEEFMQRDEETIRALERIENRTAEDQDRLDKVRQRLEEEQDEHARLKEQARVLESVMSEAQ